MHGYGEEDYWDKRPAGQDRFDAESSESREAMVMRRWPGLPEPDDGGDEMLQLLADAEGDKDRSGPDGDGELQGDQRPERDEPNGAATLTITAGRGEP